LGESVRRGGYFITGVHKIMASDPQEMYIMLGFFTLSTVSFLLSRNFSPKSMFCLLSSFSGIILVLVELVSGVFILTLNHVVYQFNLFNRINLGFAFERISSNKKISFLLILLTAVIFVTVWITFFRFFFQTTTKESNIPKWAYELIKIDINKQKKLEKISEWVKKNTESNSVIIFEGKESFIKYTEMFDELKISLMSERYVFHSIINFFSDLSDHE
ncbi:MAG: hypothetical protein N2254_09960, partial [bacterium]|nr:hypothetical protein [bacterium]